MQRRLNTFPDPYPRISVLMSVHNGARYLEEAVDSILGQTFSDFEFIIVDDGSKDGTWKLLTDAAARDTRIILLQNHSNLGLARSLNKGLKAAKGTYIARMDADDVAYPERLAIQVAMFESDPELLLVGSSYKVLNEAGETVRIDRHPLDDTSIRWQMLFHNSFCHSSVMMRADVLAEHRLEYNENCRYAQDYEMWSRLMEYGPAANCTEPLVGYRLHAANQNPEVYREQQRLATMVAASNVRKIGLEIAEQEMAGLRAFIQNRTADGAVAESYCTMMVSIFCRFYASRNADDPKLTAIQRHILMDVLALKRAGVRIHTVVSLAFDVVRPGCWGLVADLGAAFLERTRIGKAVDRQ